MGIFTAGRRQNIGLTTLIFSNMHSYQRVSSGIAYVSPGKNDFFPALTVSGKIFKPAWNIHQTKKIPEEIFCVVSDPA